MRESPTEARARSSPSRMPLAALWISSSTLLVPASNSLVRTSISAGGRRPEPRLDLDLARGDHVLGERLLVDLDRVGTLLLHGDVPLAVVAGRDRLLLAGLVRHGDLDVGQGALLGAHRAGDAGRRRGREAQGRDAGARRWREQQEQRGQQQGQDQPGRPLARGSPADHVSRRQLGAPPRTRLGAARQSRADAGGSAPQPGDALRGSMHLYRVVTGPRRPRVCAGGVSRRGRGRG